jgi:urease accessory protein
MLLADARLPVGGYTQSAGLEPALADGLDPADVPGYLALRLATVVPVEAGTAVVGLHALRHGLSLEPVEHAWAARTPSAAARATSRGLARGLLRLAGTLWPAAPALREVAALTAPPRALVLAALAAEHALSPAALARLVGYDDVQTVTAAALKLAPLDPAVATRWTWEALPRVDAVAARVATLTDPADVPATTAPRIEAWAEAHARTTRRLFSA